jgi:hypothetical protein
MDSELESKCDESYSTYDELEQGGPLFFSIMLHTIVATEDSVAKNLLASFNKLSLETYNQDVPKFVSMVHFSLKRLRCMERQDPLDPKRIKSIVPNDLASKLIDVFSKSTDPTFAQAFTLIRLSKYTNINGPTKYSTPEEVLATAQSLYTELAQSGQWITTAPSTDSIFLAALVAGKICWNCSSDGHTFRHCPKPKNESLVASNKAQFEAARRDRTNKQRDSKGRGRGRGARNRRASGDKYAPPKHGESNKREINGKPHYYHFRSKTWKLDTQTPPATTLPPTISTVVAAPTGVPPPGDVSVLTSPTRAPTALLLANLKKQMEDSIAAFSIDE